MTDPAPIPVNLPHAKRLAVLPERAQCRSHDVRLLVDLHNKLAPVTRAHVAIARAIINRLDRTA